MCSLVHVKGRHDKHVSCENILPLAKCNVEVNNIIKDGVHTVSTNRYRCLHYFLPDSLPRRFMATSSITYLQIGSNSTNIFEAMIQ